MSMAASRYDIFLRQGLLDWHRLMGRILAKEVLCPSVSKQMSLTMMSGQSAGSTCLWSCSFTFCIQALMMRSSCYLVLVSPMVSISCRKWRDRIRGAFFQGNKQSISNYINHPFLQSTPLWCQQSYTIFQNMPQKVKQKKPFLKKGTRQFLSNAQVRSQTDKSHIVDFGAPENQQQNIRIPTHPKPSSKNRFEDDNFKVQIKTNFPKQAAKADPIQAPLKKQEKPPVVTNTSASKFKRDTSGHKKKQTTLQDYLDNQYTDETPRMGKKNVERNNSSQQKFGKTLKQAPPKGSLLSTNLVRQELDEDDEDENPSFTFQNNNSSFAPIQNPLKKKIQPAKNQPVRTQPIKKAIPINHSEEEEQINFVSNSEGSEDEGYTNKFANKKQNSPKGRKQNTMHNDQAAENQVPSKIKMNYFNNNSNKTQNTKPIQTVVQPKVLTISDIPKELKETIIRQAIAEKQQQLQSELMKLKEKVTSVSKTKEKLEEEHRSMGRLRQQFEKQMQEKQKQFEEKIKSENSKLTRQKRYMKDVQMASKGDWKAKTEVADLKKALDEAKQQKKRVQIKYKTENENLRKKLAQQTQKNKLLGEQVKLYQLGKIIQQEQLQQKVKQQKKNAVQNQLMQWNDAPRETYLIRMFQKTFSLIEMKLEDYGFDNNQYYQYYIKIRDQPAILESQTSDDEKIKRTYKSGKVEHQYFGKFLKQIFPFKYQIVNFLNGDIKQALPEGMKIYSSNQKVIEYSLKTINFKRDIHYFPNNQIVQMQYTDLEDASKSFSQVFNGEQLKKTFSSGVTVFQKKDEFGNIIQYTCNS